MSQFKSDYKPAGATNDQYNLKDLNQLDRNFLADRLNRVTEVYETVLTDVDGNPLSVEEIIDKVKIKSVQYVDEILTETLEKKIEPLIDIKPEISQKIKNDQIESSTQTH